MTDPRQHPPAFAADHPPDDAGAAADGGRPSVDVIVPFKGTADQLGRLAARLSDLQLRDGDSIIVVDNSPDARGNGVGSPKVRVIAAPERQSSYYARNRGAAQAMAQWLLFLDADVTAPHDLIDRYFSPPPTDRTAVLAGGITDEASTERGVVTLAARYSHLRKTLHVNQTMRPGFAYAKTANCAVRRRAFDEVGGFPADVRSGGDADLCLRLTGREWELEVRDQAAVSHWGRGGIWALLGQMARHGSGSAWLEARYPGFSPPTSILRSAASTVRGMIHALGFLMRGRRDEALVAWLDPLTFFAFRLGRLMPNRPWREMPRRLLLRVRFLVSHGRDKEQAELDFCRDQYRLEGGDLVARPAWRYTTPFGLEEDFYAGKRVLDVGCGPRGSVEWANRAAERVGVDPLVPSCQEFGIADHKMSYVDAPAEDLPFADGSFDIALTFNSLDHVDDIRAAVGEIHRVLAPDGTWLCVVEANAAPTSTEPHAIPWNFFSTLPGWEICHHRQVALDSDHDVYRSLERNLPWESGPGLLVARLKRRKR